MPCNTSYLFECGVLHRLSDSRFCQNLFVDRRNNLTLSSFYIDSAMRLGGYGGLHMTEQDVKSKVIEALRKYKAYYCENNLLLDARAHEIIFDTDNGFSLLKANKPTALKPYSGGIFTSALKIKSTKPRNYTGIYPADAFYHAYCVGFDINYTEDDFDIILPPEIAVKLD